MAIVKAILKEEVITQFVVITELVPDHHVIRHGYGALVSHDQMVVQHWSVIDVPESGLVICLSICW